MDNQPRDSRGRWTKGRTATAAVAGGALAFGGISGTGGGAASLDAGSAAANGARSASSAATSAAKKAARTGKHTETWKRWGMRIVKQTVKRELRCSSPSFGQVRQFFERTPCRGLDRMLFAVGGGSGDSVLVSVVWVRMASRAQADELKSVLDVHGSGDVEPLGAAALELDDVRFTGDHYGSRQDGSLVVIAETEAMGGSPANGTLDDAAEVAKEFPPP